MGGAILQLVAHSASDIYLTGNPEKSFMKAEYKRHTNFAVESIDVSFNSGASFDKESTAVIPKNGDFMGRTYLVIDMPEVRGADVRWVDDVALAMIEHVTIRIGGVRIETHTGEYMYLQNELSMPLAQRPAYEAMTAMPKHAASFIEPKTLYVPLQLHFSRNPGLAIPLIGIQYSQTQVSVGFRRVADLLHGTPDFIGELSAHLAVDFMYADTNERRSAFVDYRENLITQVQHVTRPFEDALKLDFDHEVKELIFVCQPIANVAQKRYFDFALSGGRNPVRMAGLKLDGHPRFSPRPGKYFNVVQPFQHHSNMPSPGINVYSFALAPEDHAPSGSFNMSRIKSAVLELELEDPSQEHRVSVYAVNYNIFWTEYGAFSLMHYTG